MAESQQFHWFKYRECLASGKSDWKYIELAVTNVQYVKDFLMIHKDFPTWSEHWRRLEVRRIEVPPENVVELCLREAKNKVRFHREKVKRLNELLKAMKVKL